MRLYRNQAELLQVLDHPQTSLHTNGSERDIREQVIRKKISGVLEVIWGDNVETPS